MAGFKYFDFVGDAIGAAGAGMKIGEHQRKQNALQQIGQLAAGGDYNAARDAAFAAGDLNAAKSMQGFQDAQASKGRVSANRQLAQDQKHLDMVLSYAQAAQSPEQDEQAKRELVAQGVEERVVGLMGDFSNRDFFVQRSLPVKNQLALMNKKNNETALIQNYKFRQSLGPEQQQAFDDVGKIGGVQKVDTGTGTQLINKRTGQPIREVGKDIEGAEAQKVRGRETEKIRFQLPKLQMGNELLNEQHSVVDEEIDLALNDVGLNSAGVGSLLKNVPGTVAKQLQQRILTIKANIGFDKLQSMREASPTGGALGQVAVQELEALQAVLGSLEQAQSPKQLANNLLRLKKRLKRFRDIRNRLFQRMQSKYGGQSQRQPKTTGTTNTGNSKGWSIQRVE